jgi:hypothetical protein
MIPRFNISQVTDRLVGKPQGELSIISFQSPATLLNPYGVEYDYVCRIRIDDINIDITQEQRIEYSKPGKIGFEVEAQSEIGFGEVVLVDVSEDFIEFDVYFDETDVEHNSEWSNILYQDTYWMNQVVETIPLPKKSNVCGRIAKIVSRVLVK